MFKITQQFNLSNFPSQGKQNSPRSAHSIQKHIKILPRRSDVCDKNSERGININTRCISPAAWRRCCEFVIRRANTGVQSLLERASVTRWVESAPPAENQRIRYIRSRTHTRVCVYLFLYMPPLLRAGD